jgi:hypothetical protein
MKNKYKNKRYALDPGATVHVYCVTVSVRYLATFPFFVIVYFLLPLAVSKRCSQLHILNHFSTFCLLNSQIHIMYKKNLKNV